MLCKIRESKLYNITNLRLNQEIIIFFLLNSELWRNETTMTQTLSANKEELAKADQALRSMAGRVSK